MVDVDARKMLEPFHALIGAWWTEATHPMVPGVVVHGRATFEWLLGERFLIERSDTDHKDFPDAVSVIGVMEGAHALSMQYFDSRGIHRIYDVAFDGKV